MPSMVAPRSLSRRSAGAERGEQRAGDDQPAAEATRGRVSSPPPRATAEAEANTTSVSMTTAVRFAAAAPRRTAAPGCRRGRARQRRATGRSQPPTPAAAMRTAPLAREAARERAGDQGAADEHRQRPAFLGPRRLAPQHHVVEREREAADARRARRRASAAAAAPSAPPRGRPPRATARSLRRPGPSTVRSAARAVKRSPSSEPRQQHRPERHQVEQQHDADDVADHHAPVERGVGGAGGRDQDPERRRAQHLADGARPQRDDHRRGEHVDERRRPERMQALRLQPAERPPRSTPDERVEDEGERGEGGGAAGDGRARAGQCLSWRAIVSRCSISTGLFPQFGDVPAADQPHRAGDEHAEHGDRDEGRQPEARHPGVERAEAEDAGLLVEVLHRDRTAGAHQVGAAMLQQRVHRHDEVAADRAEQDQERRRRARRCVMTFRPITSTPMAMPSGITLVAWSSRIRIDAMTAPTAVPIATTPTSAEASFVV